MPRDLLDLTVREITEHIQRWDTTLGEVGIACLSIEGWGTAPRLNINGRTIRLTKPITVEDIDEMVGAASVETVNQTIGLAADGRFVGGHQP